MKNEPVNFDDALAVRFDSPAGDDLTVRQYLHLLLAKVWEEQESFNGKRPFGERGWEHDLYQPLAESGYIDFGDNPTQKQVDTAHAFVHDLIIAAIEPMRGAPVSKKARK